MKNKSKKIMLFTCLALLTLVVFCVEYNFSPITPWGGTRLAVFFSGYPVNAITSGLEYHQGYPGEYYYILTNPPYEEETDTILTQWNIIRIGIFYWAAYGVG